MFSLKNIIFGLFGQSEKANDTFKDQDGKGIWERYNESFGDDFDENVTPLIVDLVANTTDPFTVFDKFIFYLERNLGLHLSIFITSVEKKQFLSHLNRIYYIKGTVQAYVIMLKWLGFDTVQIIEHTNAAGFDSPETFDSPVRVFDGNFDNCHGCREYTIQLEGTIVDPDNLITRIYNVIEFNEPIDAKLRNLTFNGIFLPQNIITVYVSDGTDGHRAGDLVYNNDADPELVLELDVNGDLIISGPNADKYSLTEAGDLIYTLGSFFFNNALKLNGGTEHIAYSYIAAYDFGASQFHLSFWFQVTNTTIRQELVSKYDGLIGWYVYTENDEVVVVTKNVSGSNQVQTTDAPIADPNKWYFACVLIDPLSENNIKICINDTNSATTVTVNTQAITDVDAIEPIYLGRNLGSYSDIKLDSFALKGGNIGSAERTKLYNQGNGEDEIIAGLQDIRVRSNFDELIGLSIFDQSTNFSHGTLVNAPGDNTNRVVH